MGGAWVLERTVWIHNRCGLFGHNKNSMMAHFICSPGVWMPHNEPCMNILGSWHKKFANWLPAPLPPPLHCLSVINLTRGRRVETDPGTLTRYNPRAKISPRVEPGLGQFRPLANCIYTWSKYRSRQADKISIRKYLYFFELFWLERLHST